VQNDVNADLESTIFTDCMLSSGGRSLGCRRESGFDLAGVHIETTERPESSGSLDCLSPLMLAPVLLLQNTKRKTSVFTPYTRQIYKNYFRRYKKLFF